MTAMTDRRTIVAHGRLAMRELRLDAAREGRHGLQIMSFEQLAVRLAGGFSRPIDDESLRTAIQAVLPETQLGELESIKLLPGMVDAAADTLHKAWRAGIDLSSHAHEHPRLDSIARLEASVLSKLSLGMMRPCDLVAAAHQRLDHAKAVLGPVEIVGITELSPCWRPLLQALATYVPVTWIAGPRPTPPWLEATGVSIVQTAPRPRLSGLRAPPQPIMKPLRRSAGLGRSSHRERSSQASSPSLRPQLRTMTTISCRCVLTRISTCISFTGSWSSLPARGRPPPRSPTSSFAACLRPACAA